MGQSRRNWCERGAKEAVWVRAVWVRAVETGVNVVRRKPYGSEP